MPKLKITIVGLSLLLNACATAPNTSEAQLDKRINSFKTPQKEMLELYRYSVLRRASLPPTASDMELISANESYLQASACLRYMFDSDPKKIGRLMQEITDATITSDRIPNYVQVQKRLSKLQKGVAITNDDKPADCSQLRSPGQIRERLIYTMQELNRNLDELQQLMPTDPGKEENAEQGQKQNAQVQESEEAKRQIAEVEELKKRLAEQQNPQKSQKPEHRQLQDGNKEHGDSGFYDPNGLLNGPPPGENYRERSRQRSPADPMMKPKSNAVPKSGDQPDDDYFGADQLSI